MPEIITRKVGLAFSAEELKDTYPELEFLDEDSEEFFCIASDLLIDSHQSGAFEEEFDFAPDLEVFDITGDGGWMEMTFF